MKKNSKKRVLLSSVAMLMVGAVSLGTATYAWFTQDTSATANGVNVKTSKMSSLQIASATGEYGSGFTYANVSSTMKPASSLDATNWFKATAANASGFAADDATTVTAVEANEKAQYVYVEQLNILNAGKASVENVKIEVTGFNDHNYLRFALVPAADKGTGKGFLDAENDGFDKNVYALDATAYAPISTEGVIPGTDAAKITPIAKDTGKSTFTITVDDGTLDAGEDYHYNLYVWFEGQDEDCKNANAGTGTTDGTNSTPNGLTFTVTGDPVTEG